MVSDSATLRAIQMEHGLTGSFKEKPLSEWLMRQNPSESAYKQVRINAYSVYTLGRSSSFLCNLNVLYQLKS